MFDGDVIWRGLVYAGLMFLGKFACAIWMLPRPHTGRLLRRNKASPQQRSEAIGETISGRLENGDLPASACQYSSGMMSQYSINCRVDSFNDAPGDQETVAEESAFDSQPVQIHATISSSEPGTQTLYPSALLGSAMVGRGEIGFLILSLAESHDLLDPPGLHMSRPEPSDLYLILTWAIILCTIIGPVAAGILAKRVEKLRTRPIAEGEKPSPSDPLGEWGLMVDS